MIGLVLFVFVVVVFNEDGRLRALLASIVEVGDDAEDPVEDDEEEAVDDVGVFFMWELSTPAGAVC